MNSYYRTRDGAVDGPWFDGQLLAMHQGGQLLDGDQLCIAGTEDWLPAEAVLEGLWQEDAERRELEQEKARRAPKPAPVFVKRKRKGSSPAAVIVFLLVSILFLVLFWPLGLVLLVIGLASALGGGWVCSACGNKIEQTSQFCPSCKADFRKMRRKR